MDLMHNLTRVEQRHLLLLALVGTLVGSSCGRSKEQALLAFAAPEAAPAAAEGDKKAGAAGVKQEARGAAEMPRKIIRNGEISLVVKAYAPVRQQIDQALDTAGGYVSKSDVQHSLGQVSSATLVLRVPAGQLDGLLRLILGMGVVQRESITTRDVTEKYYDLRARLDNAKKLEGRLLELLQQRASSLSDLLKVEQELARVRGRVEVFEGKLRLLNDQVDLSTLTLHLSIQQRYTPPRPPSLADDVRRTLSDSWDAMQGFGRGLVLALVALLPWMAPSLVLLWLLVRWARRRRARRAARAPAEPADGAGPGARGGG